MALRSACHSLRSWIWRYCLPQIPCLEYILQRTENIATQKLNAHSNVLHSSQKVGTTQMPMSQWRHTNCSKTTQQSVQPQKAGDTSCHGPEPEWHRAKGFGGQPAKETSRSDTAKCWAPTYPRCLGRPHLHRQDSQRWCEGEVGACYAMVTEFLRAKQRSGPYNKANVLHRNINFKVAKAPGMVGHTFILSNQKAEAGKS